MPDNLTSGAKDLGSVVVSNGVGMSSRRNPLATKQLVLRKEFMMYDRARRRYYASRFSLFVSYGVNSAATMPGPGYVRSLIRMRGPVYDNSWKLQAASYKLAV